MSRITQNYTELHVRSGEASLPITQLTDDGLDMDINDAPLLRGFVLVFDGERMVSEAFIDAVDEARGILHYVFGANPAHA